MGQQLLSKLKDNPRKLLFISLLIVGILLIVFGEIYLFWERRVLSFNTNPYIFIQAETQENLVPVKITIPQVEIDIGIEEGKIVDGVWQISNTEATHLNNSANPGESGNIVIYGHNKRAIFGYLLGIKKGNLVNLVTKNGDIHKYKVSDILIVDPSNIGVVLPTKSEVLTIYTCTGFLDSKRLVVKATPVR